MKPEAKQMEAQRVKNQLDGLLHTLQQSGLRIPPRSQAALQDFDKWLITTFQVK